MTGVNSVGLADADKGLASSSPAAHKWTERALLVISFVPVLAFVSVALRRITYPYELSYVEGSVAEVVARASDGAAIYGPPSASFTPWPYPPGYFWLAAGVARVTGTDLLAARVVSFAASIVILTVLALIVRSVTGSVVGGVVASGTYAATYWVTDTWADTARVDSLFLAFLLLAVLVAVRARTAFAGFLVGLLLLAAFLTKQTALIAAAPMLVLLIVGRRRTGVAALGVLLAGVGVTTVIGNATTDGWYSVYVFEQLAGQGWSLKDLYQFWFIDLLVPFAVTAIATLTLLVRARSIGWRRVSVDSPTAVVAAATVGFVLAAWVGRLHDGGTVNVVLPAYAVLALLIGCATAAQLAQPRPSVALTPPFVAALVLAQVLLLLAWWRPNAIPSSSDRRAGDRLISLLASAPAGVAVPSHPYYARLAGKRPGPALFAVEDVLRGGPTRARSSLLAQLPWSLAGIDIVVLDDATHTRYFGPDLARDFQLQAGPLFQGDDFYPVTDYPSRPELVFVRKGVVLR